MKSSSEYRPSVSIIMPVYNVEAYVSAAIQSVLSQTWRDFELIVVNDGSTDSSPEIVHSYASSDARIRVISQQNNGLAAARNKGIAAAGGRYLYFFDSDDLLEPDALATCMEYIERDGVDFIAFSGGVFSGSTLVDPIMFPGYQKPDIVAPHTGQELLLKLNALGAYSASACLYLVSRKILDDSGLRFDEGFLHEDEAFTILLYCAARKAVSFKKCLFKRRIRAQSIMTSHRTLANVEGVIQAAVKIGDFRNSQDRLNVRVQRILRARQRALLRNGASIAHEIGLHSEFVTLVRARFGLVRLLLMDPLSILYVGFSGFFFKLRALKRSIWASIMP